MAQKTWSDLTVTQRRTIAVVGAVEAAVWALAVFVQPVGPLAYFAAGRRQA